MKKLLAVIMLILLLGSCGTVEKKDPGYWDRYSAGNTP
jgi:uncharacterized protein YceK